MDRLTRIALESRPKIRPLIVIILGWAARNGLTVDETFQALDMVRSLIEGEQRRCKVADLGIDISKEKE